MGAPTELQRVLMARASKLFLVGLLTGLWAAVVLSHGRAIGLDLPAPRHERLALSAHLAAIFGTFWLLAIAFTVEHTRYDAPGKRRLATLVTLVAYGDWLVTLLASILDVRGIDFGGPGANRAVAGLNQLIVVVPALVAGYLWAAGLHQKSPS
jgi:(hydroxyamino)benzene mutase